jgi:simple sugar transport system substrate-binding protein
MLARGTPPTQETAMNRTTRRMMLAAMAVGAAALALPATAQPKAGEPLKIGFVYVSPIGDAGWTFQHDTGRKEMEKALGAKVTTKYIESVPEGADAERVIRELAATGHNLIFTTSFGYMNPTIKVAGTFPKVNFEHATGYKTSKNVGIYNARFYEGRYLAGIVAGKMSKTGVAGYVAAFPIPEVVMGINAFARGMRSVNPKAEVKVIWVNSWFDPGKESEAANTLISQNADVVTHHTDSTAAVQAAEAKKVYAVGYHSDMSKYGPNAQLTAVTHHWGDYYTKVAQSVVDGKWQQDNVWGGIKDGMIKLAPFNKVVPADVQAMVKKAEGEIAGGKLHPFTGPMKDNAGKERLAAGKTITDGDLSKMDYYVEGVVGKLPTSK